jgi:hypothetical protein
MTAAPQERQPEDDGEVSASLAAANRQPATTPCQPSLVGLPTRAPAPAFNNFHSGRSLVRVSGFSVCSLPHLGEIFHYKTQQRWIRPEMSKWAARPGPDPMKPGLF